MRSMACVLSLIVATGLLAQSSNTSGKTTKKTSKKPVVKLPAKTAALNPEIETIGKRGKFGLVFGKDAVVTNDVMKEMAGLKNFVGFVIENGSEVSDDGLKHFKGQKNIEVVVLRKSKLTSNCADTIESLTNIHTLQLAEIELDKNAVKKIVSLPKLERLYLTNTKIGDDGAEAIAGSKTITELNLFNTGIHGRSLSKLSKMSQLETLVIVANRLIRADQVDALKKALPKLTVLGKAPVLGLRKVADSQ